MTSATATPVRAEGDTIELQLIGTIHGSVALQTGAFGDIYEPRGRGAGFEFEVLGPGSLSVFADFEDMSFTLRSAGHVFHGTADTLHGGAPGSLSLGKGGLRHYWGDPRRWRIFGEGGIGSGLVKYDYTTSLVSQSPGETESFAFDAFVGVGVRRYLTERLDGTLGLRVEGLSSIGRTSGVVTGLGAAISMKFGPIRTRVE